jgi:hypothetical protein
VRVRLDTTALESLELWSPTTAAPTRPKRLFAWSRIEGAALPDGSQVEADLAVSRVRTVDSRGEPRPEQRVLYRPISPDVPQSNWWEDTSDEHGWLELGPFAIGTQLELRPGWHGLRGKEIEADASSWPRAVADGSEFALFVGDQPRLVLRFAGTREDRIVRIVVLDAETGAEATPVEAHLTANDEWVAPALAQDRAYEIVAGPTRSGLFARKSIEGIPHHPVEVVLVPVTQVKGQVSGPTGERILGGEISATGRGISESVPIHRGGGFAFRGLPEERLVFRARAEVDTGGEGRLWLDCEETRPVEAWIELTLRRP